MTIGPFATEEIKIGRPGAALSTLLVPHRHHWQFACNGEHRMKPKIKRFEDWLVKQIAADPDARAPIARKEKQSDRGRPAKP